MPQFSIEDRLNSSTGFSVIENQRSSVGKTIFYRESTILFSTEFFIFHGADRKDDIEYQRDSAWISTHLEQDFPRNGYKIPSKC